MLGLIQTKIQTGRTTGGNITIEPVSDIRKCFVYVDGDGSGYLKDVSTLVVSVPTQIASAYTPLTTVSWTVIEFGGAVVEDIV